MSKSRGNVVNPDDVIRDWGADSLRLYEMFMGPLEQVKPWQTNGITGVHRFLKRAWRIFVGEDGQLSSMLQPTQTEDMEVLLHKTIKKVTEDTENMRFNTAISAMMEFVNAVYKSGALSVEGGKKFLLILSAYAPHMCEELWNKMGQAHTLAYEEWPVFDPKLVVEDTVTMSIMVAGKLRGTMEVSKTISQQDAIAMAKQQDSVSKYLEGQIIKKEIYVPGKIVNFVI